MRTAAARFIRLSGEFARRADLLLLALCVLASIFGIVMVASATQYMESGRFVPIQCVALVLGVLLYAVLTLVDIDIIAERSRLLLVLSLLFICTLFLWGVEGTTGNRSWLSFRWLPFNIQPAEICKICFVIILAKTMSIRQRNLSEVRSVVDMLIPLVLLVLVILLASRDAGNALVFIAIFLIMAFCGGVSLKWFGLALAAVAAAAPLVWTKLMREDQKQRILMIFDPSIDPTGLGVRWQTNISRAFLSGGGLTGQGLFRGVETQNGSLPAQHTDFIFAVVGEELGILGCLLVLLLLAAIICRCIYVGVKSGSFMNRLICIGIAGMLLFQVLVNVGMNLGVFPVIGLTLPFISYGGSSIITLYLAMGIISGIRSRSGDSLQSHYIRPPRY